MTSGKNLDDASDPTKFLWEFTDTELGQTWADPSISRTAVKDSSDTAWGTFFGSGYLSDPAQQANKEAYLYGILAQDANDYWKDAGGNTINRIKVGGSGTITADIKNYDDDDWPFSVGETITGWDSGAMAKIVSITKTGEDSATLELTSVVGTFQAGEEINGNWWGEADLDGAPSGSGGSLPNNALASPLVADLEGDYIADRIYVGDLYGNMYRVDNIGKRYDTAGVHIVYL